MAHLDDELLTDLALSEAGLAHAPAGAEAARAHLATCPTCTDTLATVGRVIDAGRDARHQDVFEYATPPAWVWDRIEADLDADVRAGTPVAQAAAAIEPTPLPAQRPASAAGPSGPASPAPSWFQRSGVKLAAAAVVGLIVGVGLAWALNGGDEDGDNSKSNLATSTLTPLDGSDVGGTIGLTDDAGNRRVDVRLDTTPTGDGFVQVWLLDAQTGGMVALGVMNGKDSSFEVPTGLDLSEFSKVDVSLEPFDGNPLHAATSLARGDLPTS